MINDELDSLTGSDSMFQFFQPQPEGGSLSVVDLSKKSEFVIECLSVGFFIWFFAANAFLAARGRKVGWNRDDYLSIQVVLISAAVIGLLEYFVYSSST
jgi:hypothetical protein